MKNIDKIDIRDLRVGDWVYYDPNVFIEDEYEPPKEIEISQIKSGEDIDLIIEDCYAPIPITKEILEKNGIKCLVLEPSGKRTYSCNEPPISCTFIPDRGWYLSAGPVGSTKLPFAEISKAYYVHELQHVIRDAKVDKDIVL